MKSMLYNADSINIVGGGLIGLQIASRLSASVHIASKNTRINLYDQGKNILKAWESKSCGAYRVNNGFHGIELPRACRIQTFLEECQCKDALIKIPNFRSLNIEGVYLPFDASLSDWPNWLSEGLASLKLAIAIDISQEKLIDQTLSSTKLGQLISITYDRFADSLDDCWPLFFPWFFPSDFMFSSGDEGNDFQNDVRSKNKKSFFLVPKSRLFQDLQELILSDLRTRNINFLFSKEFTLDAVNELTALSNSKLIWCASSYSLLQALNSDLSKKCISSKRHMHLFALEIYPNALHKFRNTCGDLPSEILCLDSIAPELNRLSFIDYISANALNSRKPSILMAECFTKSANIKDDLCKRLLSCLRRLFDSDLSIKGYSYARPTFTLDLRILTEATDLITNYASDKQIVIPEIYYGPINMAKCGIIAESFFS